MKTWLVATALVGLAMPAWATCDILLPLAAFNNCLQQQMERDRQRQLESDLQMDLQRRQMDQTRKQIESIGRDRGRGRWNQEDDE